MEANRYHRQMLLPSFGPEGQSRLARARVVLVGCGALGGVIAEQLVRAGVGRLRLIDRDIVEWTNLQRQVLFEEEDARKGTPKAVAAAERLGRINSEAQVEPVVADLHGGNVEALIVGGWPSAEQANADTQSPTANLILDGTDNAETRYLLNDVAVKEGIAWIYGACIGTEGRTMLVRPGVTPCLRCLFPDPPAPGELPTCDTAGVLGPAAAVVASLQAAAALRLLTGDETHGGTLVTLDVWRPRFHVLSCADDRRADCPTCGRRQFEFLNRPHGGGTARLCGRDAVQIQGEGRTDLGRSADRLAGVGAVERTRYFVRCRLEEGIVLTLFADGRAIIQGTGDVGRARSIYARFVGV